MPLRYNATTDEYTGSVEELVLLRRTLRPDLVEKKGKGLAANEPAPPSTAVVPRPTAPETGVTTVSVQPSVGPKEQGPAVTQMRVVAPRRDTLAGGRPPKESVLRVASVLAAYPVNVNHPTRALLASAGISPQAWSGPLRGLKATLEAQGTNPDDVFTVTDVGDVKMIMVLKREPLERLLEANKG